jgi:hypothetical protein
MQVFYDLMDNDVNREMVAREVPLSAVSGDTLSYTLTPRAVEVWGLRDNLMDTDDDPLMASWGSDYSDVGYTIGTRGESIKFHNWLPDSTKTYYLRVAEEPAQLIYGGVLQAETSSTTALLADTGEYGDMVLDNDEYNGIPVQIESGTTGKGLNRLITDFANSGSTTTITVDSAWTLSDDVKYSTGFTLPRAAHNLIILKAATYCAHWIDKDMVADMELRFARAWDSALQLLQNVSRDAYAKPWIVRSY